jgi:hypothetical protein
MRTLIFQQVYQILSVCTVQYKEKWKMWLPTYVLLFLLVLLIPSQADPKHYLIETKDAGNFVYCSILRCRAASFFFAAPAPPLAKKFS